MNDTVGQFFTSLWDMVSTKHETGVYNTVSLGVLLLFPVLVILTCLVSGCHCLSRYCGCLCCRCPCCLLCPCCPGCPCCQNCPCCRSCCCCRKPGSEGTYDSKADRKKKKKPLKDEDLWISVKADSMSADRMALTVI